MNLFKLEKTKDTNDVENALYNINKTFNLSEIKKQNLVGTYRVVGNIDDSLPTDDDTEIMVDLFWYRGSKTPTIVTVPAFKLADGTVYLHTIEITKERVLK